MAFVLKLLLNSAAILLTGMLLPGVHIEGFGTAVLISLLLGAINATLRPIIFILTLPINILTLGLFSFVTMGLMVLLVTKILPGFIISNFLWTIPFALIVSFLNWIFSQIILPKKVRH